ncbi:MAG: AAA family ATPase [Eubacteriales bacterium]
MSNVVKPLTQSKTATATKPVSLTGGAKAPAVQVAPAPIPKPIMVNTPAPVGSSTPIKAAQPQPSANNPFIARDLDCSNEYITMAIYGDFGSGKTFFAGSAALVEDYSDVLYVSLEGGEKGLRQLVKEGKKAGIDVAARILVIPVSTYKQYANIYEFLKLHVNFRDKNDLINLRRLEAQIRGYAPAQCADDKFLETAIPQPKKFQTVITDSLTEAQRYCMYQLLGIDPLKQRLDVEPDSAEWKDWGRSRDMINFLVGRLKDLPINNILICGQDTEQDAAKKFHYNLLLPGKLSGDVRGKVDCVGYLNTAPLEGGQVARRLYFVGGAYGNVNIAAKHRFGDNLKSTYLENPSMLKVWHLDND